MSEDKSLRNVIIGFIIGVGSVLPGVSGGILAVGFGIYERLVTAIGNIRERLRPDFWFLFTVGGGLALGAVTTVLGLDYAFGNYTVVMMCLFLGLVAGQVPGVWKLARDDAGISPLYVAMAVLGLAIMVVLLPFENATPGTDFYASDLVAAAIFMFCGFVMAMAKIVPGLSGTAILLAMGLFTVSIERVADMDLFVIASLGIGFVAGIFLFAKIMSGILERFPRHTYYLIFGLTIGSVIVILFSTQIDTLAEAAVGTVAAVAGVLVSFAFAKYGGNEAGTLPTDR